MQKKCIIAVQVDRVKMENVHYYTTCCGTLLYQSYYTTFCGTLLYQSYSSIVAFITLESDFDIQEQAPENLIL